MTTLWLNQPSEADSVKNIFACYIWFLALPMRMSVQCGELCLYNIVCSEHECVPSLLTGVNLINYFGCPPHSTLYWSLTCPVFSIVHTVQICLICLLLVVSTVDTECYVHCTLHTGVWCVQYSVLYSVYNVRWWADSAIFSIPSVLVLNTHLSAWTGGSGAPEGGGSKSKFGEGLLNVSIHNCFI